MIIIRGGTINDVRFFTVYISFTERLFIGACSERLFLEVQVLLLWHQSKEPLATIERVDCGKRLKFRMNSAA